MRAHATLIVSCLTLALAIFCTVLLVRRHHLIVRAALALDAAERVLAAAERVLRQAAEEGVMTREAIEALRGQIGTLEMAVKPQMTHLTQSFNGLLDRFGFLPRRGPPS